MRKQTFSSIGSIFFTIAIVVIGLWAVTNRQTVVDWWRLQSYKPSPQILQLADNTTMHERGRELFYLSAPVVEGGQLFNEHCTNHSEQTIVLGCYKLQQIYLFDVTDPRLNGVEEVTAAHEMLHAAYERMSREEKERINPLLKDQIDKLSDARLTNLIKLYNKQEPGELYNEMHSILGTEYRELSPALESYYKQYFADRQKVIGYSEQYESIFSASQARIAELDARLETLRSQVEANNTILEAKQTELEREMNRLNIFRQRDPAAYNQAVPSYNAKVREFNVLVAQNKQLVEQFNVFVKERNREAAAQSDLYHQLDSRYQAVPQN